MIQAELMKYLVALGSVFLVLLGAYEYGRHAQTKSDQAIFDKMKIEAQQQALDAAKKKGEQDETTNQIASNYSNDLINLNRVIDRMRVKPATTSPAMPAAAVSAVPVDATLREYGSACTRAFYEAGLEDALKLKAWQDWAIKEHIPVK